LLKTYLLFYPNITNQMDCHLDNEPYILPEQSELKQTKENYMDEKSADIFPHFRVLLNNKDIQNYREGSGGRFRIRDLSQEQKGFELIMQMSERLRASDVGLAAEYRLAKGLVIKEGIHNVMENIAKSLSVFPPIGTKHKGVDFQDLSGDFEVICGKFYNFRKLESTEKMQIIHLEAMFLSDFGDAYCGVKTMEQKSSEEQILVDFVAMADKYARSRKEVEDDTVMKLYKQLKMERFISKESKEHLDKLWSENHASILSGLAIAGALVLGLSFLASASRRRSK